MSKQAAVDALALQLEATYGRGEVVRELQFAKAQGRRWRFDCALPSRHVAVEVQGGVWIQGRHSRGAGMEHDYEKHAAATALGWRVLYATPRQVRSGEALRWVVEVTR